MMQHNEHIFAWLLWRMADSQHDAHVWDWRADQCRLRGFYAHLVRHQEPLGLEFERVLGENLWDLYAR